MTIPAKDRGDLIREHGERIATLNERIDNLRRDVERLDKKFDELRSRRWALWQLLLAGLLTSILAIGTSLVMKWAERSIPAAPDRVK